MSFREQRNFIEILRSLGYQHTISFDSFRQPNFVLVADILFFLITRYDPTLRLSDAIATEVERVTFLKSIAEVMATKMRIKLSTKKLYGADGYAVKEMLKIASMLDRAIKHADKDEDEHTIEGGVPPLSTKTGDIRRCRQLATDITTQGAKLFDLLKKEEMNREARQLIVGLDLDLEQVAHDMRTQIATVTESVTSVERQIADIASDESNLEAKIEKKRADLERNQQRLKSLTTVRPAFMDEYEQIESDLREHYAEYLEKYRNMTYLEHQLDRHMAAEQQEVEEATRNLRRMQERLRQEDVQMMRNGRWGGAAVVAGGRNTFGAPDSVVGSNRMGTDSDDGSSGDEARVEIGPGGSRFAGGRADESDDSNDILGSDGDSLLSSDEDDDKVARGRHSGESGRMNFDADMNSESSSSGSDPFGGDGSSAGSSLEGSGDSDNEF